jgi:hypothetical protein
LLLPSRIDAVKQGKEQNTSRKDYACQQERRFERAGYIFKNSRQQHTDYLAGTVHKGGRAKYPGHVFSAGLVADQ